MVDVDVLKVLNPLIDRANKLETVKYVVSKEDREAVVDEVLYNMIDDELKKTIIVDNILRTYDGRR